MDINKVTFDHSAPDLCQALGFTEDDMKNYTRRILEPIWKNDHLNVAKELDRIYNDDKEPFAMRVFGLYAFGKMCGHRETRGSLSPSGEMPKAMKKMLREMLEELVGDDE